MSGSYVDASKMFGYGGLLLDTRKKNSFGVNSHLEESVENNLHIDIFKYIDIAIFRHIDLFRNIDILAKSLFIQYSISVNIEYL